jgi:Leishmanolysin/Bacterial Ig-like domain (group 2)/Bacterial Ig-like domain (group 1)
MPMPLRTREARLSTVLLALCACSSSEPRVPTTVTLTPSSVSFTALDQTQQLSASVADQSGNPLTETNLSWSSNNPAVATVSSTGLVTATGVGSAQVTAASGSANAVAEIAVVQTPTQLSKVSGDNQNAAAGEVVVNPLVVEVGDALGNPVAGATVVFAVSQGGGSVTPTSVTTSADGIASTTLTMGPTVGTPQLVSASISATAITVSFTATAVAGPPASISLAAGNNQHAAAGTAVPVRPAVTVRDAQSNPVAGVAVVFEVVSGGGSITGASQVTNANGRAEVGSWTLGAGANVLQATAAGTGISGNPVMFTASTAVTAFDIEVRFLSGATSAQAQAFTAAEQKWEGLVVGDLPNLQLNVAADECDTGTPAINETVDDVIVFVTLEPIDGVGGILGQAGPCFVREPGFLPLVGVMFFDSEDLEFVENEGLLEDLIVHEMAHVLGFGTLWPLQGLLAGAASGGGLDPHFTGPLAIAAFDDAGGSGYAGAKVPVEADGGAGTADSHWRESVFDNELMTGFINLGANPLSAVTVAALDDQGYAVDASEADPFTLAPGLRIAGERRGLILKNDIRRLPVKAFDSRGRLTRMFRR